MTERGEVKKIYCGKCKKETDHVFRVDESSGDCCWICMACDKTTRV